MNRPAIYIILCIGIVGISLWIYPTKTTLQKKDSFRPSDWAYLQRFYPYWDIDATVYDEALEQKDKIANLKHHPLSNTAWQLVGPTNIGGRITDIEFDPLRPDTVYFGAATGGVFKSIDAGNSWFPIFDDQAILSIGDIGIDPTNSDILYVGTGEANGGHNNFAGGGVYKSLDGGVTWTHKGLTETTSIGRVIVDYQNPNRVFLAAVGSYFKPNPERGVYRSNDAGETWEKVLFVSDSTGAIDLVMHPTNPNILFSALWERVREPNNVHLFGPTSGIYKSEDGGDTWNLLTIGLPNPTEEFVGRIGLAISKSEPNTLYALYTNGTQILGLYKSVNEGEKWVLVSSNSDLVSSSFSWYFGQVRVHPNDAKQVYLLDVHLQKTLDSGISWDNITDRTPSSVMHVDNHALAFHPKNPNYILLGTDGGINISQNGGSSWTKVLNLPVTQFYEINFDPFTQGRYYGGTQDNGTIRTLSGRADQWRSIFGGDGFYVNIDPRNPNIIFASSQYGSLGKSVDGGSSFNTALNGIDTTEPTNWSTPIIMDANNPDVMYYGTNRVYRSDNLAETWEAVSPKLTNSPPTSTLGTISTIAVAPSNSAIIYTGTDDGRIWQSLDSGDSWQNVNQSNLPNRWITRIAIDPNDSSVAYITYSGLKWRDPQPHIYSTHDLGQTWVDISNNLPDAPINAIAIDPHDSNRIFIGTDVGAFVTFDKGTQWNILGTGLPAITINDLKIDAERNLLIAGTHGRSMYVLDISTIVPKETETNLPNVLSSLTNYPNPFNRSTTISFTLHESALVTASIFDLQGRKIVSYNWHHPKGTHAFVWDGKNNTQTRIPTGMYILRLETKTETRTLKLILSN